MQSIAIIIVAVIAFLLGRATVKTRPATNRRLRELRKAAQTSIRNKSQKREAAILNFITSETLHQEELKDCKPGVIDWLGVTRDMVEQHFSISETTARKYLNLLEEKGVIQLHEQDREATRYTPVESS